MKRDISKKHTKVDYLRKEGSLHLKSLEVFSIFRNDCSHQHLRRCPAHDEGGNTLTTNPYQPGTTKGP